MIITPIEKTQIPERMRRSSHPVNAELRKLVLEGKAGVIDLTARDAPDRDAITSRVYAVGSDMKKKGHYRINENDKMYVWFD